VLVAAFEPKKVFRKQQKCPILIEECKFMSLFYSRMWQKLLFQRS